MDTKWDSWSRGPRRHLRTCFLHRFQSLQVLLRARLKIRDEAGRRSIWNLYLFATLKVGGKHDLI